MGEHDVHGPEKQGIGQLMEIGHELTATAGRGLEERLTASYR